jgi:hypothetical protein
LQVSSAETLESHFRGEPHQRKVSKMRSASSRSTYYNNGDSDEYDAANQENEQLKREVAEMQEKYKILLAADRHCKVSFSLSF